MSGCDRLSDRMPAVALGRAIWSSEDERHLAGCPDCRTEWDLVRQTARLGAGLPRLDHTAIVSGLRRDLAERPVERPRRWGWAWTSGLAAAGVAGLIWAGTQSSDGGPGAIAAGGATPPESLTDAQADSLLQSDDEPLAGWSMLESPGLGDLNEDELEQVLRTWEG